MKKNSTFIGIAFLTAILMLSVGYAAIADVNLNINGTANATVNNENFKVKFDNTIDPVVSKTRGTATAKVTNDLEADINVSGLTTTGDTVTATYTVKNESTELGAILNATEITNSNPTYFEVTQKINNSSLNAGESTTVVVTVKLIKTPIEDQSTTIKVPLTATAKVA